MLWCDCDWPVAVLACASVEEAAEDRTSGLAGGCHGERGECISRQGGSGGRVGMVADVQISSGGPDASGTGIQRHGARTNGREGHSRVREGCRTGERTKERFRGGLKGVRAAAEQQEAVIKREHVRRLLLLLFLSSSCFPSSYLGDSRTWTR